MKNKYIVSLVFSILSLAMALILAIRGIVEGNTTAAIATLFWVTTASAWVSVSIVAVIIEHELQKERKRLSLDFDEFIKELEQELEKKDEDPFEEFCGGSDNDKGTGKTD